MLTLAVLGFIGPNGIFVYAAIADLPLLRAAASDPIALALMIEAFLLTALFAWIILRAGNIRPGWAMFVVLSIVGSLACSVPGFLYLASRHRRIELGA